MMPPATAAPSAPGGRRRRRVLVVLGMHRGGTSAVAGLLSRLGVDFGPRLMPANADNPSGYYEHNDIVNLHDRLLLRLDAAWDSVFPPRFEEGAWAALAPAPGLPTYRDELLELLRRDFPTPTEINADLSSPPARPWGLKDPRLCLLLPWWEPVWAALDAEPCFVLVLRSPAAVAASLARRDGFCPAKSHLLWLQHALAAERHTRGRHRCVLDYDHFLEDWRTATAAVERTLGSDLPIRPEQLPEAEAAFLSPSLRHHPGFTPLPEGFTGAGRGSWVSQVWEALQKREVSGDLSLESFSLLDAVTSELDRARLLMAPLLADNASESTVQLRSQTRITRWYEREWQQSRWELKESERKLAGCRAKLAQRAPRLQH